MKRPVVGTIALLLILAGGLFLAWQYKDSARENGTRSTSGAAARSAIQASFGIILPSTASGAYCFEEDLEKTKMAFCRFDIPTIDLPGILDQRREGDLKFPSSTDLKTDGETLGQMGAQRDSRRPWWNVDRTDSGTGGGTAGDSRTLRNPNCAQKMGLRNMGAAQLRWRVQVCVGDLDAMTARVYIAFSEEPAAGQGD